MFKNLVVFMIFGYFMVIDVSCSSNSSSPISSSKSDGIASDDDNSVSIASILKESEIIDNGDKITININKKDFDNYIGREKDIILNIMKDNEIHHEILEDNRKVSDFIKDINVNKVYNFDSLLNINCDNDIKSVAKSLNKKMTSDEILMGLKRYLNLIELNSNERRLIFSVFILNRLDGLNLKNKSNLFKLIEDYEEFINNCSQVNPYYSCWEKVNKTIIPGNSCKEFFNYDFLNSITTVLYILEFLNETSVPGSIKTINTNLSILIKNFTLFHQNTECKTLYENFVNLQNLFLKFNKD